MERPQTAQDIRALIRAELGRAISERDHPWRTPVLATCDSDGHPQARTMVLRAVDQGATTLQFFTDQRSPKAAEVVINPRGTLVFWCPRRRWQLRLRCALELVTDGYEIRTAWSTIQGSARASDYLTAEPPGKPISGRTHLPDTEHQLAILFAHVVNIDWLELQADGHRRAQIHGDVFEWVTP